MKTTVEIPDSLLEEARRLAAREGTTVRALVEEGLRRLLAERKGAADFRLRRATFKGQGLQPDFVGAPWGRMRDTAYEGRGA
ncbi:MAG TPA: type II toxin-antitoxin system VapB family antitoxin [Methylomirabilota bacterium]|nr:type II toxin-antitoxin system VapB family antitoxin [Methylomirabilota bacterium]